MMQVPITAVLGAVAMTFLAFRAEAQLLGTLRGPGVEKGVTGFKFAGFRQEDDRSSLDGFRLYDFEVNHGVSDRLQLAFDTFNIDVPDRGARQAIYAPSLKYLLFSKGSQPVEAALFLRYTFDQREGFADQINPGILVDSHVLGFKQTSNLYLLQKLGEGSALQGTIVDLRVNGRYAVSQFFEPGIEFQGQSGPLGTDRRQNFQRYFLGPSIYGTIPFGEEAGKLAYQVGYLFGMDDETPDSAVRWRLEYRVAF